MLQCRFHRFVLLCDQPERTKAIDARGLRRRTFPTGRGNKEIGLLNLIGCVCLCLPFVFPFTLSDSRKGKKQKQGPQSRCLRLPLFSTKIQANAQRDKTTLMRNSVSFWPHRVCFPSSPHHRIRKIKGAIHTDNENDLMDIKEDNVTSNRINDTSLSSNGV